MSPPPTFEPAELQSIRSMLSIAKILAVILGVIALIGGIAYVVAIAYYASVCSTSAGDTYCGGGAARAIIGAAWVLIAGVVAVIVYMQMGSIEAKVNARQYEVAKSQTLLWMILGFIFGIILGVVLLVAYIKYDPLIDWQRVQMMGGGPPPGYAPSYGVPPYAPPAPGAATVAPPPPAAPPPPTVSAPVAPFCPKCGRPTTYIPQYGRYYCYTDQLYV